MERNPLLREVFDIPEVVAASDFVLQLHTGVDDPARTVADYVATESLAQAFDDALGYTDTALVGGKAQGVFLHGSFGSGKSHFMAVLELMLRGAPAALATPGLQKVVAKHDRVLGQRLLTVDYHLIGAASLEQAVFSGFTRRVSALHPERSAPMLHKSDLLFADAAGMRAANEEDFFARLNANKSSGCGAYGQVWTPQSYDRAASAGPNDKDRAELAGDLVSTMFKGFAAAGEWLDFGDGLEVMTRTAKDLGYDGLVLFLDELVLWLASHASDPTFVSSEASKVAKLVESGRGQRAVPLVSFVARQRELSDFIGSKATGVQRAQVSQTIQYWEDRFDTITLSASNLPEVAHKRLLTPVSGEAAARVAGAVAAVKATASWNILLDDESGSGEDAFAKVYPFSPALVDVLVALSGRLQRERTALKVMAHLLSARRDTGRIEEVIGVGDLYDVMIASGEQPLSEDMRALFAVARNLFDNKFTPMLLTQHALATAEGLDADHQFHKDARLAKTLLVAALVPEVKSLSRLTAGRLAALNHGTVQAWIPGEEATQVLQAVRGWAQQIGELHIGEGADPAISVELSGVDYDSVLSRVEAEDTPGARRNLLRRLLFAEMGVPERDQLTFAGLSVERVWRGTRRSVDVVFGNIRDVVTMPEATLRADGDRWKLVVDYPFDEGDHGPQEDVNRLDALRIEGDPSRTVAWVPYFLTAARQADLGKLVQLDHLLGGVGGQFDSNAAHLPVDQRALARQGLENLRRALTETMKSCLRQAYGIEPAKDGDIDRTGFGEVTLLPTLWREEPLQRPVGATLSAALDHVIDQMLAIQFPDHPRFDSGTTVVSAADLRGMWDVIVKAAAAQGGRLDPLEQKQRATVRRVASPLGLGYVGDAHFVFDQANFTWFNPFLQAAAAEGFGENIPVAAIRGWLAPYGITKEMGNLIIASFALLADKQFALRGVVIEVAEPSRISEEMVLVDPRLPNEAEWLSARSRAAELFGLTSGERLTAANVSALAVGIADAAQQRRNGCRDLVDVLELHASTLGLTSQSARLVTAKNGQGVVEGLASAGDHVDIVCALAAMNIPAEPQPLAKSMSTAAELARKLRQHDWTTLDAVAIQGDSGDPEAAQAIAPLRQAATVEELHSPLMQHVAAGHAAATQWLINNGIGGGNGGGSGGGGTTGGGAGGGGGGPSGGGGSGTGRGGTTGGGSGSGAVNPDEVTLSIPEEQLSQQASALEAQWAAALKANPGKQVVIRWRLQ